MAPENRQKLRSIPSVNSILERDEMAALANEWSFAYVSFVTKSVLDDSRKAAARSGNVETADRIAEKVKIAFMAKRSTLIRPVINATGVALHTNLGRAPLDDKLLDTVMKNCAWYCNLEYDLETGKRSQRGALAGEMAAVLAGAEAGVIVNNNAAAVLLVVNGLARDREVLVSRGELIQIGGGFRIPEIITASGALLREVGTTNRTTLSDYAKHITKRTGLVMKVHKSNFDIRGFTEDVPASELALLAHKKRLPMLYDLGSGMLNDLGLSELEAEPDVPSAVRSKADLVCFSGDKLFGGPQAGIIVGRKKLVNELRRHPLYRPLRPDKFALSALEHALLGHLVRPEILKLRGIFAQGVDKLRARAARICESVGLEHARPVPLKATAGGGSTPNIEYDSYGLSITIDSEQLERKLRGYEPPIIVRRAKDKIMLDLSTVFPEQDDIVIAALRQCLS